MSSDRKFFNKDGFAEEKGVNICNANYGGLFSDPRKALFKKLLKETTEAFTAITVSPASELETKQKLLEEKEKQLHDIKRSARDEVLKTVLTDRGLRGKTSSGVIGILIDYDNVPLKSKENDDGLLHQLEDHVTDTRALETEINTLKLRIERLEDDKRIRRIQISRRITELL